MGTETHSHLLAPAALANSDWWLPSGHHHFSITAALSKQTVHQQRIGRGCHTALVSTTFPHLCWLMDKDPIKNTIKCIFCLLSKAWSLAISLELVRLDIDFCCCMFQCIYNNFMDVGLNKRLIVNLWSCILTSGSIITPPQCSFLFVCFYFYFVSTDRKRRINKSMERFKIW